MALIGVLVNPDAGLGGKLGFKGSDGRAEEARKSGAKDRAGPRMRETLTNIFELIKLGRCAEFELIICGGKMGSDWIKDIKFQEKAKELGQLIVPGAFSPSEIQQAIKFGFL